MNEFPTIETDSQKLKNKDITDRIFEELCFLCL